MAASDSTDLNKDFFYAAKCEPGYPVVDKPEAAWTKDNLLWFKASGQPRGIWVSANFKPKKEKVFTFSCLSLFSFWIQK